MIQLPGPLAQQIREQAAAAYPEECCGLLLGRWYSGGKAIISGVMPSDNLHPDPRRGFEVDPQTRFDAIRGVDQGRDPMLGHYHSHPDHPAAPSARDLAAAYEPELIWLIVAVDGGLAERIGAWRLNKAGDGFDSLPLAVIAGDTP